MLVKALRVRWKRSSTASPEVNRLELDKIGLRHTFLDVSSQGLSVRPRPSVHMSVRFFISQIARPSDRPSVRPSVRSSVRPKTEKIVISTTNTIRSRVYHYDRVHPYSD